MRSFSSTISQTVSRIVNAEAFVFDFYGTLVEVDGHPPAFHEILSGLGYDCGPSLEAVWQSDAFDGLCTPANEHYDEWRMSNLRSLARMAGVAESALDVVVQSLLEADRRWTVNAVSGAGELLEDLRSCGKSLGICSNWDYPLERHLRQAALPEMDAIAVSCQVGARKPHRLMYEQVCRMLDVSPMRTVMIGDTWSADVLGALRAGLSAVWLRDSRSTNLLPRLVLDFSSLIQLRSWLAEELGSTHPTASRSLSQRPR